MFQLKKNNQLDISMKKKLISTRVSSRLRTSEHQVILYIYHYTYLFIRLEQEKNEILLFHFVSNLNNALFLLFSLMYRHHSVEKFIPSTDFYYFPVKIFSIIKDWHIVLNYFTLYLQDSINTDFLEQHNIHNRIEVILCKISCLCFNLNFDSHQTLSRILRFVLILVFKQQNVYKLDIS